MKVILSRLFATLFFAVLSLPWFYGAGLAVAQPEPTLVKKPIGEILHIVKDTDWCKTAYAAGTVFNLQSLADYLTPEKATQVGVEIITSGGDLAKLSEATKGLMPVKNFFSKQKILKVAYASCAMIGVIQKLLHSEAP